MPHVPLTLMHAVALSHVGTIATATCCIRPYGTLPQTDVVMPIFGKLLRDGSVWA